MAFFTQGVRQGPKGEMVIGQIFSKMSLKGPPGTRVIGPQELGGMLVVGLWSETVVGPISVQVIAPPDVDWQAPTMKYDFREVGEFRTVATRVEMKIRANGVHWFDVLIGEELLTRIPITIDFPF